MGHRDGWRINVTSVLRVMRCTGKTLPSHRQRTSRDALYMNKVIVFGPAGSVAVCVTPLPSVWRPRHNLMRWRPNSVFTDGVSCVEQCHECGGLPKRVGLLRGR